MQLLTCGAGEIFGNRFPEWEQANITSRIEKVNLAICCLKWELKYAEKVGCKETSLVTQSQKWELKNL